jgi:hypothetical protein
MEDCGKSCLSEARRQACIILDSSGPQSSSEMDEQELSRLRETYGDAKSGSCSDLAGRELFTPRLAALPGGGRGAASPCSDTGRSLAAPPWRSM